ncbi:MAG: IS66 family transposase [Flavisolibacter sp.]|nr:IS66 family transposase [Flavisolibacter sp.]
MEATADYKALYEQSQLTIASLKSELEALKRMIFGSRQERFTADGSHPAQLSLGIPADSMVTSPVVEGKQIVYTRTTAEPTGSKSPPVRLKLSKHLPRRDVIIEPQEDVSGLTRIGEEITEELDYESGKLFVRRIIRPKYISQDNSAILIAPMGERPLPKAICGAGLLTQIVIYKYIDYLPLNRQMERLKREGITLPYATLTDWVGATAKLLAPLYEALRKEVVQSDYLHVDETPIKVLDKDKKGTTHKDYLWVYHRSLKELVLFDYQMGRGREGPKAMLADFQGHLQTDGYSAYEIFSEKEGVTLFHCMTHARRKFFEAQTNDAERARYVLGQTRLLYAVERTCKEKYFRKEQIRQYRQKRRCPF